MKPMCREQETALEVLESRLALALGAGALELYYPEGFANSAITETVSITNPGSIEVRFELWARYETGERDQLIRTGTVPPGGWQDVLISNPDDPASIAVRPNTPFAFVLRGDGELAATLRHDDFGATAGESFTARASSDWSIARVTRDNAAARDFIVMYNPGADAQVQVEFWADSRLAFSLTAQLGALRRGGWNVNQLVDLPAGEYGVRIRGSTDIVVGHSHYNLIERISAINIATFDRGALAGAILSAEFDGRDRPGAAFRENSVVAVFNPGTADATVTLHYIVRDGSGFAPEPSELTVPALGMRYVSLKQLGFTDHDVSVVWESDARVAVAGFTHRQNTFIVNRSARVAATEWTFATAFIDRVDASVMNTEDVLVFNPTDQEIEVTVTFMFRNGSISTQIRTLAPFEVEDVDTDMPVQHIGAGHPFSVRVDAAGPVVASLEHWNRRRINGAFYADGTPGGTISTLADVLVFPQVGGEAQFSPVPTRR